MKNAFRIFRRKGVFYSEDTKNGKQKSLQTRSRQDAERFVSARNEAARNTSSQNLQIGRIYLAAADPESATRTWKDVHTAILPTTKEATLERWERIEKDHTFSTLWPLRVLETWLPI